MTADTAWAQQEKSWKRRGDHVRQLSKSTSRGNFWGFFFFFFRVFVHSKNFISTALKCLIGFETEMLCLLYTKKSAGPLNATREISGQVQQLSKCVTAQMCCCSAALEFWQDPDKMSTVTCDLRLGLSKWSFDQRKHAATCGKRQSHTQESNTHKPPRLSHHSADPCPAASFFLSNFFLSIFVTINLIGFNENAQHNKASSGER